MCRPDHYGVEYEINPWMDMGRAVDHAAATAQWQALHDAYVEAGVTLHLEPQVAGLPDMVFSANAGVVFGNRAVLSRFRHPERQGEEGHWREAFTRLGFDLIDIPAGVDFEGAGDALFVGDRLFMGHGFRTDVSSHALVARALDVETVSLQLVDNRFYHLDTCFCPLSSEVVMYAPAAFSDDSLRVLRAALPGAIEVPVEVAEGFTCNAMPIGDTVYSSPSATAIESELRRAGFGLKTFPMGEFLKSGGGVRCLSLPLR